MRVLILSCNILAVPWGEIGNLDLYFIPDGRLTAEFVAKGVDESKIRPSGIPIKSSFFTGAGREQAKCAEGIGETQKHLLVTCGSMRCGPVKEIVRGVAAAMDEQTDVTVVCGTNKKLYRRLSRDCRETSGFHVRGYTDDIPRLMDSADIYLTKHGGLSTSEARAKKLPMVCINTVGGGETYNANFFEKIGAAVSCRSADEGGCGVPFFVERPAKAGNHAGKIGNAKFRDAHAIDCGYASRGA